jgi:hypothetical protein
VLLASDFPEPPHISRVRKNVDGIVCSIVGCSAEIDSVDNQVRLFKFSESNDLGVQQKTPSGQSGSRSPKWAIGNALALLHGCCTLLTMGELAHLGTPPFAGISWWAMLGSNQRSLPCEGSVIVCWRFLELAKRLQIAIFMS